MALFKILKGKYDDLNKQEIHHGYMYITEDSGEIFVDMNPSGDGETIERVQLNANIAKYLLDHNTEEDIYGLWIGTQEEYSNIEYEDNILYYVTDEQLQANEIMYNNITVDVALDNRSTATNLQNGTGEHSLIQAGVNIVGDPNIASGINSVAFGLGCQATANYTFASGYGSIAGTQYAHAEGQGTEAYGRASHAEGSACQAYGTASHAEGGETWANGIASHAEGKGTYAGGAQQHVQGRYNIEDDEDIYAHIVGNGSDEDNRSNCHTLDWDGNAWFAGNITANKVYGAVWNDYAEYRECDIQEPGRVVCENGDDTLSLACGRMLPGANIISDTFGFAIGETDRAKTPIAVSGRVLAYTFEDRETFKPGEPVCSGPNGTVSKMSREEIINYPECIIGYVSAVPQYEIWGENNIPVNNRIWIKVR